MKRRTWGYLIALAGSLAAQAVPLRAQDGRDSGAEYDSFDGDVDDDAIALDDGGDNIPDRVGIVDEDGDPSFDDEDGDDPLDDDLFQDRLPDIVDYGNGDLLPEAWLKPKFPILGSIYGGTRVASIVSGFKVRDGAAPFFVQIRYSRDPHKWSPPSRSAASLPIQAWMSQHVCGGSVIAQNWVITAAHCVHENHIGRGLEVVIGSVDISRPQDARRIAVDRVVVHSGFEDGDADMYHDDIALVHLTSPANVQPVIRYTGGQLRADTWLSTLGWGKTHEDDSQWASSDLFRADIKVIDNATCSRVPDYGPHREFGRPVVPIHDGVLCGGNSQGKACSGDSGGPVVFTNGARPVLVGIVSWTHSNSCEQLGYPGVYTRVGAYEGWIRQAMTVTTPGESTL